MYLVIEFFLFNSNHPSLATSVSNAEGARPSQGLSHHKKIVVQASTNDLLACFAHYIGQRCAHLAEEAYINPLCYMNSSVGQRVKFEPRHTINWLRSADCALLIQVEFFYGLQEVSYQFKILNDFFNIIVYTKAF